MLEYITQSHDSIVSMQSANKKKANHCRIWAILGSFRVNREFKKRIDWRITLHWYITYPKPLTISVTF